MMEMVRRYLSLGISLPVVFSGLRSTAAASQHSISAVIPPSPIPAAVPEVPPTTVFSGTVVRDGSRFALREPDGTMFALDSAGRAWSFEGEEVEIMGYFHPESRLLHICGIEAIDDVRAEAV